MCGLSRKSGLSGVSLCLHSGYMFLAGISDPILCSKGMTSRQRPRDVCPVLVMLTVFTCYRHEVTMSFSLN